MRACKSCRWCGIVDENNGFCHFNPPIVIGTQQSMYIPVGPSKPGCSHHELRAWALILLFASSCAGLALLGAIAMKFAGMVQ